MSEVAGKISQHPLGEDNAEFTEIVDKYQRRLLTIAYRMLGNFEDAKDSAQEAFVRIWKTGKWQNSGQEIFTLLARVLVNLCIDRLRKQSLRHFFSLGENTAGQRLASMSDPANEIENNELNALLESSINRLKPRQKAVFILRDIEGHRVKETANIIGCSENSVLTNLHLARKNMRKWIKPYLHDCN